MWPGFAVVLLAGGVSVQVPQDALGGRVILRLLDEGFEIFPPGTATSHRLEVGGAGTTLWVRAQAEKAVWHEVQAESRAVAELELLQRATLALEAAGPATADMSTIPVLRVDPIGVVSLDLRGRVALSVLRAGYGLTRTATRAIASLCVEATPTGPALGLRSSDEPCPQLAASDDDMSKTVRLLVARPTSPTTTTPVVRVASEEESPWLFTVRGGGGAIGRDLAVDPVVGLGAALHRDGLGARVDLDIEPASDGDVTVLEVLLVGGPSIRFGLVGDLKGQVALRAGLRVHTYDVVGSGSGTRLDFAADLPVTLSWVVWDPISLEFQVVPGVDGRSRRHVRGDTILWSRGAARVSGTLGLAYDGAL